MEITSSLQQGFVFKLGVERHGFALNLDVWALRCSIVVHLVACGFSFHISLFPTIATGTIWPALSPARNLEKLEWLTQTQTETFTFPHSLYASLSYIFLLYIGIFLWYSLNDILKSS